MATKHVGHIITTEYGGIRYRAVDEPRFLEDAWGIATGIADTAGVSVSIINPIDGHEDYLAEPGDEPDDGWSFDAHEMGLVPMEVA